MNFHRRLFKLSRFFTPKTIIMRSLFLIAIIAFFSCGHHTDKKEKTVTDSLGIENDTIITTRPVNDTPVINQGKETELFTTVNSMLQEKFPGKWKIINDSIDNWPVDEFNYFIKDKRKEFPDYPYIATGDYNADNKKDYAALIVNTTNKDEQRIAILLDSDKIIIWNDDVRGAAINTNPKEDIGSIDGKKVKMKSEGINVEFFEKSSWVLYWNGTAFKKLWTSD